MKSLCDTFYLDNLNIIGFIVINVNYCKLFKKQST